MMKPTVFTLSLITSLAISPFTLANVIDLSDKTSARNTSDEVEEHIVIIGDHMSRSTEVITNPKQPRLPLPAYDGSGYLRTIPGFSIARKGGAGGEPSFRGLGGSRISIIDDGQFAYGTCGGRMDPPTSYVYPESYDSISVVKGPQTVKYGPVGSAGTVLFEKDHHGLDQESTEGRASATTGAFGRQDYIVEFKGGDEHKYIDFELNNSKSDHFKDGDGQEIQSKYDRSNSKVALGWTPDEETVVELSYGRSSGSAEYADRANKGRVIENENTALLVKHETDGDLLKAIDIQLYQNRTNHIMDQFDQGVNSGINVRRATHGGRAAFDLNLSQTIDITTGIDFMDSTHEGRKIDQSVDNGLDDLLKKPFADNMRYQNYGAFIEGNYKLGKATIFSGIRSDNWETEFFIAQQGKRDDSLVSGFTRLEYKENQHELYIGAGHSQRIPDYWEFIKADPLTGMKAFDLEPENTTQLDAGWLYKSDIEISSSVYFGKVDDYILIDSTGAKTVAKNIDATIWGGEFAISSPITQSLSTQLTVNYSRGDNDTENTPLGQISPLEARVALDYQKDNVSFGLLWRIVAKQDRISIGQGNIAGQDLAESNGFGVVSLSAGWKYTSNINFNLGIENILDKTYSEHISRSGAGNDIPGGQPLFQVTEPGRNAWAKMTYVF